jgi:hypothetical protein
MPCITDIPPMTLEEAPMMTTQGLAVTALETADA